MLRIAVTGTLHGRFRLNPTPTTTALKAPANPNHVFDPANFVDTADAQNLGSSVNLERAPKWLKPPVGARFGFGSVLAEVTNTGAEDEKKHGKVQIKHVEGGMKALVKSRAGKATLKEGSEETVAEAAKVSKDTYSTLLVLFDSDPKSAQIELVGYDASPAALDEALAAVRAETYEPVVSFTAEATHVPRSSVGEGPEGSLAEYAKKEDDGEASEGADAPGAAPSEVSVFSSDAKQVDTASTATEPSLFGDEPVGAAPGHAAGDFFNTIASDNNALPTRPRAALVPHLSFTGESSAAATVGSRPSSAAGGAPPTPSFPTKSFRINPKKEGATSALVTRALIAGNLDTAVELCIQAGRWADALLLAQGGGLVMGIRVAYFDQPWGRAGGYLRVFKGVIQGTKRPAELFSEGDVFASLVGELGERVWSTGEMAKEEKREVERVCFMEGKKLDKLIRFWEEPREEEQGGQSRGGNYVVRAKAVQIFIEKATVFSAAVGFFDPDLPSATSEDKAYPLASLHSQLLEYTQILSA
ncbi:Protein transport protein SEC31 OS=Ustilago maydis (strain 521 / FGSC 9021) GN=SEC31 PE=3 SV=1 [Rhizoctonia solani AG-1 IB]|uniref:Protein transport protein SEC31 n=1 Tax=Thanatephorus cucumeris (strain AG1-IB / isolate 7/3/14) TaxID=1108050 RepID=A0A0B7FAZ2_THACB|nr:Protein transport protein SEC31 OS=Ustilago maydis (strain 521 / FGSC 9021) GN=SEC31 PE=3 SV=1 [Rhizoctonia solani AG-1 IB]